jgi:hypothetical protein
VGVAPPANGTRRRLADEHTSLSHFSPNVSQEILLVLVFVDVVIMRQTRRDAKGRDPSRTTYPRVANLEQRLGHRVYDACRCHNPPVGIIVGTLLRVYYSKWKPLTIGLDVSGAFMSLPSWGRRCGAPVPLSRTVVLGGKSQLSHHVPYLIYL